MGYKIVARLQWSETYLTEALGFSSNPYRLLGGWIEKQGLVGGVSVQGVIFELAVNRVPYCLVYCLLFCFFFLPISLERERKWGSGGRERLM